MLKLRFLTPLFDFAIFMVLFTVWANFKIPASSKPYLFNNTQEIPPVKVGLLLGASKLLPNGNLNPYFKYRIDAALELFHAGKIKYIIVSGDNSVKSYDEPTDMKNDLVLGGVPDSVIYLDYAGFRTFDSVIRAKKIFGQSQIISISQQFHNERAVFIARNNGMEAYGYNARDLSKSRGAKTNFREIFAKAKVFIDILIDKKPKFLGEEIQIGK